MSIERGVTSVSVAMATYNGSRFIRQQLDSIASQTVLPTELVVTDDDSTDDTVGIVRAFATTAPFPVRVHQNATRLGYRANFMSNIALCSSEVIALCDQDDLWEPAKLERCLAAFGDPDVLLCFHEAWLIDSENERGELAEIYRLPASNPPLSLFPMRNPFGFAMVFRRSLLMFSDLWDRSVDNLESRHRMAHDQWLFFLASVFGVIVFIDEPLAGYRQHENNTYGFRRTDVSFLRQRSKTIERLSHESVSFSIAARARANILDNLDIGTHETWRARAQAASASYQQLSRRCSLRSPVYNGTSILGRFSAWRRMVLSGGYSTRGRWGLRRRDIVWDLAYLLFPRRRINAVTTAHSDVHKSEQNDIGAILS